MPLTLAILLSGTGRTLQNLLDLRAQNQLDITIKTVIASRPNLQGTQRAAAANLPTQVVNRKEIPDVHAFSDQVFSLIDTAEVDLVVMAGWLSLLIIPPRYANKIINIHPSLLPAFGGRGMYGHKVHQAVLDYGCKITGCTAHFVDATYDTGPIILQRPCPVLDTDTPDTLAARVFEEEKQALPQALTLYHQNRLTITGRRVTIANP